MSESKHTPIPWRMRFTETDGIESWEVLGPNEYEWIADCGVGGNSKDCAAYIVHCVNNHQQLVDALEAISSYHTTMYEDIENPPQGEDLRYFTEKQHQLWANARAALEKARNL